MSRHFPGKPAAERTTDTQAQAWQHVYATVERGGGSADKLSWPFALKADGTLGEAEFERVETKVLA